jgi:NADPH-dependent 2,4-dienoyl-CoA reductase/sulfur reductase-like enzyme
MKIIVIGSIEAGVSAAMMLASGDASAKITVYERGSFYTCGTCGLPHYLTEDLKTLKQAIDEKERELASHKIEAHLRHEVLEIKPSSRTLTIRDLDSDRIFSENYDKLVIATGNHSLVPSVPGADRVGVQTFKSVEDLLFLKEYVRTPYVRDIVILGGSYAGLEMAKAFHKLGRNVRIIEKERRILPDFDAEVAEMIRQELEKNGLKFQLGETVREFPGQTFIEQVRTDRGTYPCDLCISAIGVVPNTELAATAGIALDKNGAILVNEQLETSVSGIYAVGNCTAAAAGSLRTGSLHTAGLEIARTGMTQEEAQRAGRRVKSVIASGNDRPGICPNPNKVTIKLVCDASSGQILGAQAWGRKNASARINAIAVAAAAGMTAKQLEQVSFVYSSSASSIWDPIQIVCNAVK